MYMARPELRAETRKDLRKSHTKKLRREGKVLATVYGKGVDSRSIQLGLDDFARQLKTPGGRLALIDLKIDGKSTKSHPAMIQEIQRDAITNKVLHVDFHRVSLDEPVTAAVPITLSGEAPGQKQGGMCEQFTNELQVKALPDKIPSHIDVDVSTLELGDSIHVNELNVPDDVEVLGPPGENVVATVRLPVVHVEEVVPEVEEAAEEAAPEEGAAPEVEEESGETQA